MSCRLAVLVSLFSFVLVGPGSRALDAQAPTIGRYVPSSVQMYGAYRSNPAGDRLSKPFEDAFTRLVESGIFRDIFDLATMELSEDDRHEIGGVILRVVEILGGPDWEQLLSTEVAFGFRFAGLPHQMLVFRVPEADLSKRHDELHKLLEDLAEFAPDDLYVTKTKDEGATLSTLRSDGVPMSFSAVSKKDAVALILAPDRGLVNGFIELVDSKDAADSIVESEKFRAAQSDLPKDSYFHFLFDLDEYLGQFQGLLAMGEQAVSGNETASTALKMLVAIFVEIRKFQHIGMTETAKGDQFIIDEAVSIEKSDKPGFIEKLIADQQPIEAGFLKVVPKDAKSFFLASGVKPLTIYDKIIEAVGQFGDDGEQALAMWKAVQDEVGVDFREEVLSWIDGGGGIIHLPGEGLCGECVAFLRVTDTGKAKRLIERAWKPFHKYVTKERKQEMELVDVPTLDNFKELQIPAMPWLRPVIGTPQGVLVIASSRGAAEKVAAAVSDQAESIRDNPRFQALGIPEEGNFTDLWYADVEDSLEGLANLLGTGGFFLSLLPEEEDTKPAVKVGHILTKLAAFLRDLDIAVDVAGWSSYDAEKQILRSRSVTKLRIED